MRWACNSRLISDLERCQLVWSDAQFREWLIQVAFLAGGGRIHSGWIFTQLGVGRVGPLAAVERSCAGEVPGLGRCQEGNCQHADRQCDFVVPKPSRIGRRVGNCPQNQGHCTGRSAIDHVATRPRSGDGLDVHQSVQFPFTATAQIVCIERQIAHAEIKGEIARAKSLSDLLPPAEVPAGLPSSLLERRPDIRQAEDTLIVANAQIGAARAQHLPRITLTGLLGMQIRALASLFDGGNRQLSVVPAPTAPIFNAGRLRANVRIAEALIGYQKSVKTAFREVSDSLEGCHNTSEQEAQQDLLVKA